MDLNVHMLMESEIYLFVHKYINFLIRVYADLSFDLLIYLFIVDLLGPTLGLLISLSNF